MNFKEIRNLYSYFPIINRKFYCLDEIKHIFYENLFIKILFSNFEYELNYLDFFLFSFKNKQTNLIVSLLKMSKQFKIVAVFSKISIKFNLSIVFDGILYLFKLLSGDYKASIKLLSIGGVKGWLNFNSILFYLKPFFKNMKKFYPFIKNWVKKKNIAKKTIFQIFKVSADLSYFNKHELFSLLLGKIYFISSDVFDNYICFNNQKNHKGLLAKKNFIKKKKNLEIVLFGKNLPEKFKKKLIYCLFSLKMASLFPNILLKFFLRKNKYLTLNYKFSMYLKIGLFLKKEMKILNIFILFLDKKYWYLNKIKKNYCRKFFIEVKKFLKKNPTFKKNKSLKFVLFEEEKNSRFLKKNTQKKKNCKSFASITNNLIKILFEKFFTKKFKKIYLNLLYNKLHKKNIYFPFISSLSVKIPLNVLKKVNLIFDIFGKFFISENKLTKLWIKLMKRRLFVNSKIILKKCFSLMHHMIFFSKIFYNFILLDVLYEHSIIIDNYFLKIPNYHQKVNLVEKFTNSCLVNCFLSDLDVYHIFSRIFAIQRLFLFFVKKDLNLLKFKNQKKKASKKFDSVNQTKYCTFLKIKKLETFYFNFIINLKNLSIRLKTFNFFDDSPRNLEKAFNFNNFF